LLNKALLTDMSCISEVWDNLNSCAGARSLTVEKSKSSRLMKTLSVCGADEELEVRTKIECSLTCPVKLYVVMLAIVWARKGKRSSRTEHVTKVVRQHHCLAPVLPQAALPKSFSQ